MAGNVYGFDRATAPMFRLIGRATPFYLVRESGGDFPSVLGVGEIDGRWYETVASPDDVEWIRRPEERTES